MCKSLTVKNLSDLLMLMSFWFISKTFNNYFLLGLWHLGPILLQIITKTIKMTSVTRLGDLLDLRQLFKLYKGVKISIFSGISFGQIFIDLWRFFLVTLKITNLLQHTLTWWRCRMIRYLNLCCRFRQCRMHKWWQGCSQCAGSWGQYYKTFPDISINQYFGYINLLILKDYCSRFKDLVSKN